jgi:hypothetical protein
MAAAARSRGLRAWRPLRGNVEHVAALRGPFGKLVISAVPWPGQRVTQRTREHPHDRYAAKVKLIKGLYKRGWAAEEVRQLFRVIDWMINLPRPLELDFCHEINRYEQEKKMPFMTTPERIGREEGLAEGRVEGRAEGIELALKLKFGDAGLRLMPEIRAITDAAKLKEILLAIPAAATPEDLRRVWAG